MQKLIGSVVLLGCLGQPLSTASAQDRTLNDRGPAIRVRVYNDAGAAESLLAQARGQAGRILTKASIEVEWIDRADPTPLSKLDLFVKIYPQGRAEALRRPKSEFGFALQPSDGSSRGVHAIVFFDRIERLKKLGVAGSGIALGHVMAHEIGHLLLGNGSHARGGVMTADWRAKTLKRASTGALNFSDRQARKMQRNVRERTS